MLDWVYPPRCGLCGQFGPSAICGECAKDFKPIGAVSQPESAPVSRVVALFQYESRAAQAVRRLKYGRVTSLVEPLASMVRSGYEQLEEGAYDFIAPVPIHWRRRAMRGFNQSELISSKLPAEKLRPGLVSRIRMTRPQVGLTREERVRNLIGAFQATPDARGASVLLVDDVTTSGHTAEQCAIALLAVGAKDVGLLALTGER